MAIPNRTRSRLRTAGERSNFGFATSKSGSGASAFTVQLIAAPTWTDNADGTATVTFATSSSCYAGIDYGTSAGVYTKSTFNYDGAGPALELANSHTVPVPDAQAGGTESDGTYYYRIWMQPAIGVAVYSSEYTGTIDNTAPTLSSPQNGTETTDGTTNFGVTTNEGNGTLYWAILTNNGSCTDAQLKAGSGGNIVSGKAGSQAISSTGAKTIASVTGLSAGTDYEIVFLHRDAAGNDSSQSTVGLTTLAAGRSDDFNRADGALGNPSDGGAAWEVTGNLVVSTNKAAQGAAGDNRGVLEASDADVDVIAYPSSHTGGGGGLIARWLDGNNYIFASIASGTQIVLYKVDAGSFDFLDQDNALTINDGDKVTLRVSGTTVQVLVNDVLTNANTTSSFNQTQTKHGFRIANDASVRFDNFSIT